MSRSHRDFVTLTTTAVILAVFAALAFQPAALASGPALGLTISPQRSNPSNLVLTAELRGGSSTSGQSIDFFVVSTEFGRAMNVAVGSATLGRDGKASVIYTPTWTGSTQFVARLGGPSEKDSLTATATYVVTAGSVGPLNPAGNPDRPFQFMGEPFLGVLLGVVALVWLTLIITLLVVARRLPRLAGRAS